MPQNRLFSPGWLELVRAHYLGTPIFDSWPLLANGEKGEGHPMPLNISGPFPRWGTLLLFLILGLALIVVPHVWLPESLIIQQISDGIGIAILTSAILAFTIERWLRADLAKDIILAAIGYHLPAEYRAALKAELMRIAAFTVLCEQHLLKINIVPIDGTCVKVTAMIERTFRNISSSSQSIPAFTHIDEWCLPAERSSIQECQIERIGGAIERTSFNNKTKRHDNMSLSATSKEIKIGPGQRAKSTVMTTEIKRPIDDLSFVFTRPTLNPSMEINVPKGFEFEASFGPDEGVEYPERFSTRRVFEGMYWPLQRMRVHWWTVEAKSQLMT
jgi:hypothetical protein